MSLEDPSAIIKSPKRLDEVTLMRIILALLIVFYHSFLCFSSSGGGWSLPTGTFNIPLYKWLCRISSAFTLEAFVFISGYLFSYKSITSNYTINGWSLIVSKLKRLIIPSILFSTAYFVLFYQYKGLGSTLWSILNGCGHMWFLPMLFWCFIGGWLLEKIKICDELKLVFLVLLNLFAFSGLPLRISVAFSYLLYFWVGGVLYKYSSWFKSFFIPRNIAIAWIVFVLLFVILRPLQDILIAVESSSFLQEVVLKVCGRACQMVYACSGLVAFYVTAVSLTDKHHLSDKMQRLASCSFGVYLFQQFVLMILYYKTSFPEYIGAYFFPWVGFVIATVTSFCLSALLLKTKKGRFLIG